MIEAAASSLYFYEYIASEPRTTLDHYPNPALITLVPSDAAGESTKAVVPPSPPPPKNNSTRAGV